MRLRITSIFNSTILFAISSSAIFSIGQLTAQINVLSIAPPQKVAAKAGSTVEAPITLQLRPGYHVNSDMPSDPYLIPLRLTWSPGTLESSAIVYPKPHSEKFSFSEKPLSIFSGDFNVTTRFKVPANAPAGQVLATGKLRYQACNDRMCLPPRTLDVIVPLEIQN